MEPRPGHPGYAPGSAPDRCGAGRRFEGDAEKGIPHWFEYKIQFSYLGAQRELDVHQNDIIIEFEDEKHGTYYNVMPEKVFEKSGKKYLHIKDKGTA